MHKVSGAKMPFSLFSLFTFFKKHCIIDSIREDFMNDSIFIFVIVFITAGLIYFLYRIMLGAEKDDKNDLQITHAELMEQLNILLKQKKYNIVESLAKKYLEKKASDDGVRTVLTKAYHESKKIYEAIDHAKIIIKHQPDNFTMRIFLANCYLEVEKPMQSISIFQEILEEDPDNFIAIKELAKVYYDTNQKKSSIKMYTRLEEFLDSNQEKVRNKLKIAEIHIEFFDFDLAIKEYEQILEIYPEDISVKKRLIELYKKVSDYESLIELANEVLETSNNEENSLWIMKMLMDTYRIMQNYEKALEYANLIKDHSLSNPIQSGENIAKILFEEGRLNECIELLKSLITEDPNNTGLKKELAKAYEKNQNFELAVNVYKKILDEANAEEIDKIHFEISNIYSNWAMYSFSQNENEDCFKHFSTALQYHAQNPDIYYQLGNVNQLIKNFNEAISQYKKAIELNPQNPDYYYATAECYEEIDCIYDQKKALAESLKHNPDNAKANYKLGIIYNLQNDNNSAITYLQKAIKLDENFVDAKRKLALIFEHMGDKDGAITLYEDILSIEPENEEILNNLKMINA